MSSNQLSSWSDSNELDFTRCSIKHLDVSSNSLLGQPPTDFLRFSPVNKLLLRDCNLSKADLMREMERNGVKEYQERHKKKLDQAVNNNLKVNYALFGLD